MTADRTHQDKVSDGATECREYTTGMLERLGHPADLMQTDPHATAQILDAVLARDEVPPVPAEMFWLPGFLTAFLTEFLISARGGHWSWIDEPDNPWGGHWAVSGLINSLGKDTAPLNVDDLVGRALASTSAISFTGLVRQAELAGDVSITATHRQGT